MSVNESKETARDGVQNDMGNSDGLEGLSSTFGIRTTAQDARIVDPVASSESKGKQASAAKAFTANRTAPAQTPSSFQGPNPDHSSGDEQHVSSGPRHVPHEVDDFLNFVQETTLFDQATMVMLKEDLVALHSSCFVSIDELSKIAGAMLSIKTAKLSTESMADSLEGHVKTLSTDTQDDADAKGKKRQVLPDLRGRIAQLNDELQVKELEFEQYRSDFAFAVIRPLTTLWKNRPAHSQDTEELTQRLEFLEAQLKDVAHRERSAHERVIQLERRARDCESEVIRANAGKQEKVEELEIKKRELLKGYYEDVQKLVEARVSDEKMKLAERLNKAEIALKQRDKVMAENEELQPKIVELGREKERLSLARAAMETKYKNLKAEADFIKEGYNQLTKDNAQLHMETSDLRGDIDRLTEERDKLLEEQTSAQNIRSVAQTVVAHPQAEPPITSTSTSRYANELKHLEGLVAVWQNTLVTATSDLAKTHAEKEDLNTKIQDAKLRLQQFQRPKAPPVIPNRNPAPPTAPGTESKSQEAGIWSSFGKTIPSTSREALPSSAPSGMSAIRTGRSGVEPFPALGAPTAVAPKSFTTAASGKVLRVVDTQMDGSNMIGRRPSATKAPTNGIPKPSENDQDEWQEVDRKGRKKGTSRRN